MSKQEIIDIVTSMGFRLDYDQFYEPMKEWMRFMLKDELDEPDLRWIWYKSDSLEENFKRGSKILFKAGQKAKMQQTNNYVNL